MNAFTFRYFLPEIDKNAQGLTLARYRRRVSIIFNGKSEDIREAQLSPRDPRDAVCQLKYCRILL